MRIILYTANIMTIIVLFYRSPIKGNELHQFITLIEKRSLQSTFGKAILQFVSIGEKIVVNVNDVPKTSLKFYLT